ncbi:MAG TPA: sugar phosphate isomerase/epimerase family protein [Acetobacteraceae bacterium]|nr:sugar phosphate isomerase/epimerase family protein [Acetobacteraceae bacterium]
MIRFGMHFSLWAPAWTREAAEAAIPEAAHYGIEIIEIPLLAPETIDVAHARAVLAAHGIVPSASLCLPETAMAHRDPDAAERFLNRAVDVAHALGCAFLGGVTYSALGYKSGSPPTEAEYDNIASALRPVARRAADLGIMIGLEPCNRYETHLLNTAAQGLRIFERIGAPNLVLHLDTYHMNIEEKGLAHAIEIAGRAASYIHLSESDRGVPGTGTVDWDGVFAAIAKAGFDRDLVIESFINLPPEIASALCVWRPVARDRHEVLGAGVRFLKERAKAHGIG